MVTLGNPILKSRSFLHRIYSVSGQFPQEIPDINFKIASTSSSSEFKNFTLAFPQGFGASVIHFQ